MHDDFTDLHARPTDPATSHEAADDVATPPDTRAIGATFAADDIGYIDFETKGKIDIKSGPFRYAAEADAIVLAFAIGNDPVQIVSVKDFSKPLSWSDMPAAVKAHHTRVQQNQAKWAAWNSTFDRAVWNYATLDFPELLPPHIIDPMVQALAVGLPGKLDGAAKFINATAKLASGKKLIKLFCNPDSSATPQSHPDEWRLFLDYAIGDIEAMRSVFQHTRQLALAEWMEFWAAETINARGVCIDVPLVQAAAKLAEEDRARSKIELAKITQGKVRTVDQVAAITRWLLERLPPDGRAILLKREEEIDEEDGTVKKPAKFSMTRRQVEHLIVLLENKYNGEYTDALRVLQIRLYGGSKTPIKFQRMLEQHYDGCLMGQFVFGGAGQTGRYSSKGVQLHNQSRNKLDNEIDVIDAIMAGASYDDVLAMGPDPVARKLALLIRPSLIPRGSNVFVWSDWSNIEARITPWLADYHPAAAERLQAFRDIDADPSLPDMYTRTAAAVSRIPIEEVTESIRQRGKVLDLSLQFGGSTGALINMATSMGMHLTYEEAREAVDAWRAANPWAQAFGQDVMAVINRARYAPRIFHPVGNRIGFIFMPEMMGGSLLLRLPSGRLLTYRKLRYEMVADLDDDGNAIDWHRELTCARGYGRIKLWAGIFVENMTQAVAADCLRGTLVRLVDEGFDVRAHVHDEVITETASAQAPAVKLALREVMRRGFSWSDDLPLMSEETVAFFYSKNKSGYIKL